MDTSLSALSHALSGIQSNLRGLERAAHEIATAPANGAELTELVDSLVDAKIHQRGLEASANALARIDEVLGSLIDIFA
jgi:hypothetical protein